MTDGLIELDDLVFSLRPFELAPHQRYIYWMFERHAFRWLEAARAAAKSWTCAAFALLQRLMRRRKGVWSGPTYRQSRHPFRYEKEDIYDYSPWLEAELARAPVENTNESRIRYLNGSNSVALPASGSKVAGERGDDLYATEFRDYEKPLYTQVVHPIFAVRSLAHGVEKTITHETSAGFQWQDSYDIRKMYLEKTLAGDSKYIFISFTKDHLFAEGYPLEADIVSQAYELDPDTADQQYMNKWLSQTGDYYNLALLMRKELRTGSIRAKARLGKTYVAGFDIARGMTESRDDTVMLVWEIDPVPAIPPCPVYAELWHNLTAEVIAQNAMNVIRAFGLVCLMMDFQNLGPAVYDVLRLKYGYGMVDDPSAPFRIIKKVSHSPSDLTLWHSALNGAFKADGMISLPRHPRDNEDDLFAIPDPRLVKSHEIIDLALKQLSDLRTAPLKSGNLHFEPPPHRKDDAAQALLYGYAVVRELREASVAVPPKPRPQTAIIGISEDTMKTLGNLNPAHRLVL